jgi:hypothetical protein
VGEDAVDTLRDYLKEQGYDPDHGRVSFLDIVYGRVQEGTKASQETLRDKATTYGQKAVDTLHSKVENARPEYKNETGNSDPDWENIHEHSVRLNDRKISRLLSPLYGAHMGRVSTPKKGMVKWSPAYSFVVLDKDDKEVTKVLARNILPQWGLDDRLTIKEFKDRWYNHPERLQLIELDVGDFRRFAGAMTLGDAQVAALRKVSGRLNIALLTPGTRLVIACTVSLKSQDKIARAMETKKTWVKYRKKIVAKGRMWFTARKVADQLLEVTCWHTKDLDNDGNVGVAKVKTAQMSPYEWGAARKILFKQGYTESEV